VAGVAQTIHKERQTCPVGMLRAGIATAILGLFLICATPFTYGFCFDCQPPVYSLSIFLVGLAMVFVGLLLLVVKRKQTIAPANQDETEGTAN